MPKTSVIVPVYNVEGFLEKCARSVLAQTEKDFELLLIDDGSTDSSGSLCQGIAAADPRVRVVHQENQGLGGARNTGIAQAQGEWLLFVDSDDWLAPDVLEKALAGAEKARAELAVFPFATVDMEGKELAVFDDGLPKGIGLTLEENPDMLLLSPCAWNKLYSARLFRETGVRYPPRVWYEDIRTTLKLLPHGGRVVFLENTGYYYLQRPGSIMNSMQLDRNREIMEAFDDLLGWYREQGLFEKYRGELEYLTVLHVFLTASARVLRADQKHPLLREFREYTRELFPDYRQNPYLGRLGKKRRLLLALLERRMYGAVAGLFRLKG